MNDTEAETERLEDSPQKTLKHKNVIMVSASHALSNGTSPLTVHDLPPNDVNAGESIVLLGSLFVGLTACSA